MKATRFPISQLVCNLWKLLQVQAWIQDDSVYSTALSSFAEEWIKTEIFLFLVIVLLLPFYRIFLDSQLPNYYNKDFLFPGHIAACTVKQLDAACSPLTEKLEHEQATDDTHPPRGNCNECDTIRTLRWVIVAYCWSLNNTAAEGLIKENKETAVRWIERTEIKKKQREMLGIDRKREDFLSKVKGRIFFGVIYMGIRCWVS